MTVYIVKNGAENCYFGDKAEGAAEYIAARWGKRVPARVTTISLVLAGAQLAAFVCDGAV